MALLDIYKKEIGSSFKKTGDEFLCLCPFHDEQKASFSINDEKNLYCCFACGQKGNIYTFLRDLKGFSFTDCVTYLKQVHGFTDERLSFHFDLSKLKEPKSDACKKWFDTRANKKDIYFCKKDDLGNFTGDVFDAVKNYVNNTKQNIGEEFALLFEYDNIGMPINCCIRGMDGGSYYKIPDLSGRSIYGALTIKQSWTYVVEGISDASALHLLGLPAVAMEGLNVNVLRGLNVRRLVFWVDGDGAGRDFLVKFRKVEKLDFIVDVVWTEDYDVNDYVKKVLEVTEIEEVKKKPFSHLPKSKPYLEWLVDNYLIDVVDRKYLIEDILFKKKNLYDATGITRSWCEKYGIDYFSFFCFLEKGLNVSRQLELYLLSSKKYKSLPTDFFFYDDIQRAYNVMMFEGEERALADFQQLFIEVPKGFDAEKCFNELKKKRFLREGAKILHGMVEGRSSIKDLKDLKSTSVESGDVTSLIEKEGMGRALARLGDGFSQIDNDLEVFLGGSFTLFGARTGHGKTMFCLNVVKNLLNKKIPVRYFCMEMMAVEVTTRLLAMKEGVSYSEINSDFPKYFNKNKSSVHGSSSDKKFLNYFNYHETLSLEEISDKIEERSIVFIDYVQSISSTAYKVKGGQTFEFLKNVSIHLKKLALEKKAAIFGVIQMADNFDIESDAHRAAYQGFITGAKAITYDADLVLSFGEIDGVDVNRALRVNKSRHTKKIKNPYNIYFDDNNLRMSIVDKNGSSSISNEAVEAPQEDVRKKVFTQGRELE